MNKLPLCCLSAIRTSALANLNGLMPPVAICSLASFSSMGPNY